VTQAGVVEVHHSIAMSIAIALAMPASMIALVA
jgi:hypothetical protein